MAAFSPCRDITILCKSGAVSLVGSSAFPLQEPRLRPAKCLIKERGISQSFFSSGASVFPKKTSCGLIIKKVRSTIPRCSDASNSSGGKDESSDQQKTPFGYTRKDVLLIGLGVTLAGIGLERGLEFIGVDPLQAGNVVQLVLVLGLTIGWISTYIFRVSNKEMTYAQQLRDYEDKVMEIRELDRSRVSSIA
ncbi:uncharacterized protein LOC111401413 isoform X1 [Olea europaea subsp. europaea]|uniref:Uncharacterized protein LOC111401413 isoform X1 n=1 Tax=Olea europaea subsp. europaea TaxID=158383 RepID=A0A8S0USD8_OLEEU|nr:uncharacterized protein LOC111401413 isoform X1 [Olea europaea subsp. europaea]